MEKIKNFFLFIINPKFSVFGFFLTQFFTLLNQIFKIKPKSLGIRYPPTSNAPSANATAGQAGYGAYPYQAV